MGWPWSATPSKSPSELSSPPTPQNTSPAPPSQPPQPPPPAPSLTQPPPQSPRTLSRDEQAEAELQAFLAELSSEPSASSTASKSKHPSPSTSKLTFHPTTSERDADEPDSLYPSHMSCSQAFDSAFYCQSLGGKFNDIYRYGELRSCSEHWSAFWFCMRNKSAGEEERKRAVQEHYRKRAAQYRTKPSSEDVWEVRRTPVLGAFEQGIDG